MVVPWCWLPIQLPKTLLLSHSLFPYTSRSILLSLSLSLGRHGFRSNSKKPLSGAVRRCFSATLCHCDLQHQCFNPHLQQRTLQGSRQRLPSLGWQRRHLFVSHCRQLRPFIHAWWPFLYPVLSHSLTYIYTHKCMYKPLVALFYQELVMIWWNWLDLRLPCVPFLAFISPWLMRSLEESEYNEVFVYRYRFTLVGVWIQCLPNSSKENSES